MRRVICAALLNQSGDIICGPRHFDGTMHATIARHTVGAWEFSVQGFVDQHGVFMDREEAWHVAIAAGQIIYRCGGDGRNGGTLYSENLY